MSSKNDFDRDFNRAQPRAKLTVTNALRATGIDPPHGRRTVRAGKQCMIFAALDYPGQKVPFTEGGWGNIWLWADRHELLSCTEGTQS
jgi:hypothetical protein